MRRFPWISGREILGPVAVAGLAIGLAYPAMERARRAFDPAVARAMFTGDERRHALVQPDSDGFAPLIASLPPDALVMVWTSGPDAGNWTDFKAMLCLLFPRILMVPDVRVVGEIMDHLPQRPVFALHLTRTPTGVPTVECPVPAHALRSNASWVHVVDGPFWRVDRLESRP